MGPVDIAKRAAADTAEDQEVRPGARLGVASIVGIDGCFVARVALQRLLMKLRDLFQHPQLVEDPALVAGDLPRELFPLDQRTVADRGGDRVQHVRVTTVCQWPSLSRAARAR